MPDLKPSFLVDSLYVSSGGGLILLNYFLQNLKEYNVDIHLLADIRNQTIYSFIDPKNIIRIKASLIKRHHFYIKNKDKYNIVFSFNNIPPSLKLYTSKVYTYFHQFLFLENENLGYSLKGRLLLNLKKIIIGRFVSNTDLFIVQTMAMKDKFSTSFKVNQDKICVLPFFEIGSGGPTHKPADFNHHFVYISDGHPHKNHRRLLEAWKLVNAQFIAAKLTLTISEERYPRLCEEIEKLRSSGINVINVGFQDMEDVLRLYNQNKFLIYPSLAESFGLGLIEAVHNGCEVIASDLSYVKSVVQPLMVFNPYEPKDIAQKVIHSCGLLPGRFHSKLLITNQVDQLMHKVTSD